MNHFAKFKKSVQKEVSFCLYLTFDLERNSSRWKLKGWFEVESEHKKWSEAQTNESESWIIVPAP